MMIALKFHEKIKLINLILLSDIFGSVVMDA